MCKNHLYLRQFLIYVEFLKLDFMKNYFRPITLVRDIFINEDVALETLRSLQYLSFEQKYLKANNLCSSDSFWRPSNWRCLSYE